MSGPAEPAPKGEDRPTDRAERTEGDDGPPAGPPADAATTFEDLPGDLFGEEEWASAPSDERPPAPEADAAPRGEPRERPSGGGGPADAAPKVEGDDLLDAVGRLFPGRIVALEPLADDAGPDGGAGDGGAAPPEAAVPEDEDD